MLRLDQAQIPVVPSDLNDSFSEKPRVESLRDVSPVALAQSQLREAKSSALQETQEDLAFALGGRLRDARRGAGSQEGVRGRVLAQKLLAQMAVDDSIELGNVLEGSMVWLDAPELLPALQNHTTDPGQMALMLMGVLVRGKPSNRLRRKLESALEELTGDDDMALSLFGVLECGEHSAGLHRQLRSLYHRASESRQKPSQWLSALGEGAHRKRKLRAMLRLLAYELSISGQPIVGSHLAAVIGDIKQLLLMLGLEAHCGQMAASLSLPLVNGESLLRSVVVLVEQIWVSADMVSEMLPIVVAEQQYRLIHALSKLVQLLPDECFVDSEHKGQLEGAIAELRDRCLDS
ncbi:SepL/TyeA/HrpJ family type III secretion system gatekeeper [Caballeronia sp. EK]|uniref:HrpJ domain-containing protein n=1 Tax=Caballeronia sp. EK TaxID=2767469 RepID=UPI0016557041|nr:HrpJ domain-containing protein [Caballeronia sp. EK]MBC8642798.1 SepL/TyeA/HrpJ family type III secretion system gatekeeper [Caballeronia sp. EK]